MNKCPECGSELEKYTKKDGIHPVGKPSEPYFVCPKCSWETEMFISHERAKKEGLLKKPSSEECD